MAADRLTHGEDLREVMTRLGIRRQGTAWQGTARSATARRSGAP